MEYLAFLQSLRETTGGAFDGFFLFISHLVIGPLLGLLPAFLYWCVDKRAGTYLLMNLCFGSIVNQSAKNTACVYRPWIRWNVIHPIPEALGTATGYSFPSGHSQLAASFFGALAVLYRKNRTLLTICVLMIPLVMFSRNWLGVHTLADVLVGASVGLALLYVNAQILNWVEKRPTHDVWILVGGCLAAAFLILYATNKTYPVDYGPDGKILVDPTRMIRDAYLSAGGTMGFVLGWFLERRWIHHCVEGSVPEKVFRFLLGGAILGCIAYSPYWIDLGECWNTFAGRFAITFYLVAGFPLLWKVGKKLS